MRRSQAAADVLAAIDACNNFCERGYKLLRSRGLPPADCNSIAVSFERRDLEHVTDDFSDCQGPECMGDPMWDATHTMRVTLTRICMGPDGERVWNTDAEDAAAACHYDDLDDLETCLQCADWSQLLLDHDLEWFRVVDTVDDLEADGGAFSSHVTIAMKARECCTVAP